MSRPSISGPINQNTKSRARLSLAAATGGGAMRASVTEEQRGRPKPFACAPCSIARLQFAPMPMIMVAVIVVNYIFYVVWTIQRGVDRAMMVVLFTIFHLLLALVVMSWLYTCATDPGVPPESWQRRMAAQAKANDYPDNTSLGTTRICRKSGLYKPERSHYCSVTKRLTLNMDHFCPWVLNTIGFYNRKFFLLFILYTICLIGFTLVSIAPQLPGIFEWARSENSTGLPPIANLILIVSALLVDVVLLFLLCPFLWFHFQMVMKNQTTIDGDRFPQFDVGTRANLQQVFGRNVWLWLLPLYCSGPDGDGVHWPVKQPSSDLPPSHAQRTSPYAITTDSPRLLVCTPEPVSDGSVLPLAAVPAASAVEHPPSSTALHPTPIARGQSGVAMVSILPADNPRRDGMV